MERRTIISVEGAGDSLFGRLTKAEADYPDASTQKDLHCSPHTLPKLSDAGQMKAYGCQLRDALARHPAIQSALGGIFLAPPEQTKTLCFQVGATAELVRWEALCDFNGNFVAMDDHRRLGRIAEEPSSPETGVRPFHLPLRLMAFLSAAERDATGEWDALKAAIATARAQGLPLEARVYLGQSALLDASTTELAAAPDGLGISVFPIPASEDALKAELDAWHPHLVHFFCHGLTDEGARDLEFANLNYGATHADEDKFTLPVSRLVEFSGIRDALLVVLNCCQGAEGTDKLRSMVYDIVARGSVPAAIGMQEPVAEDDASVFSGALYPELFNLLRRVLQEGAADQPALLDLTAVLAPARRALQQKNAAHPTGFRTWTFPVLYLRREAFQVLQKQSATAVDMDKWRARVRTVANLLRTLPGDAPPDMRDDLLGMLDKPPAVPLEMRPNRDGQFALS